MQRNKTTLALLAVPALALAAAFFGGQHRAQENSQSGGSQVADLILDGISQAASSSLGIDGNLEASQRSLADSTIVQPSRARACVADLRNALLSHDSKLAGDLIREYFSEGSAAVEGLLDYTLEPTTGFQEGPSLGILFKSAAWYLVNEPEVLAPLTVGDFATLGLDMLGQGDHIPMILGCGFDELGPELGPEYLVTLLDAYENRDIGPPSESQYPLQALAKTWAKTMGPEVEPALADNVRSTEVTDFGRSQAANMLLARDWRRLGPDLLNMREDLRTDETLADSGSASFDHVLASGIMNAQPYDRTDYYRVFAGEQDLAVSMAWQMDENDAQLTLAQPATQDIAPSALDLLKLRSNEGDLFGVGMRLLENPDLSTEADALEPLVIGTWLSGDLAYDPRVVSYLDARFESRSNDPARFWRSISVRFSELEDHQAMATVLPLLERSKGENNYARKQLLAMANSRFEDLNLE